MHFTYLMVLVQVLLQHHFLDLVLVPETTITSPSGTTSAPSYIITPPPSSKLHKAFLAPRKWRSKRPAIYIGLMTYRTFYSFSVCQIIILKILFCFSLTIKSSVVNWLDILWRTSIRISRYFASSVIHYFINTHIGNINVFSIF
jgi:hypothetical protein